MPQASRSAPIDNQDTPIIDLLAEDQGDYQLIFADNSNELLNKGLPFHY